ncbi:MAG: hypothetical protein QW775_05715 [Ignisphaera sp.]|uniref:Uncharacterized protein n=1 Tax=Ignisphaera aggregans TaxID=334771 RepID=A0A7C4JJM0_9CREN
MYRELVLQSAKLSITGKGMIYIILFVASSTIYLFMFDIQLVFVNMMLLSFVAVLTSILSDKKTLVQYILVLILSGARKKLILICIRVYLILRLLPIIIAYVMYLLRFSLYIIMTVTLIAYVVYMFSLSYVLYKVLRR